MNSEPGDRFGGGFGFCTASGKAVKVSEEALRKARSLWETTEEEASVALGGTTVAESNADVEEKFDMAGEESSMFLESCPFEIQKEEEEVVLPVVPVLPTVPSGSCSGFGGFSTASGKKVDVSEAALKKARSLWESEEIPALPSPKSTGGFQTDSGNGVKVSEEALKKVGSLWEGESVELPEKRNGFSTASGKSVSVSEESLKKVQSLWEGEEFPEQLQSISGGFTTASGKDVKVSEESLKKVQSLWEGEEFPGRLQNFSGGFATASGKNVKVSEEALKKAKSIWTDELKDEETESGNEISFSEDFDVPLKSSTPKPVEIFKERPKPKAFITPFKKTAGGGGIPALSSNSNNVNTPVLGDRRVSNLKGHHPGLSKSMGSRPGKFTPPLRIVPGVKAMDSLKRARGSVEDLVNQSKSPKLHSNRSLPLLPDENAQVPASRDQSSIYSSNTPARISVTESQEILYSSKALLEDDDDFGMDVDEPTSESSCQPLPFSSIVLDNKPVSHIRAWVARVYPVTFICKTSDGKKEFHSETSYERILNTKESRQAKEMEKLFTQVEEEHRKARAVSRITLTSLRRDCLNKMSIDDLLKIIESGDDFGPIQVLLSDSKLSQLREAQERKQEERRRDIQKEVEVRIKKLCFGFASVTSVIRLRLVDLSLPEDSSMTSATRYATLSFWRPCEDLRTSIVECQAIDIFSVSASQISDDIKLNSTRETHIQPFNLSEASKAKLLPTLRRCYSLGEVMMEGFSPPFREFDMVGFIVHIEDATSQMGETVYFADGDENFISIKFWRTLSDEGLDSIIQLGRAVSASNIQWRQSSTNGAIRHGYCQDTTRFSLRPKESYLHDALDSMKKVIQDTGDFISTCSRKIQSILNGEIIETPKTPPLVRRIRPHVFELNRKKLINDEEFS